MVCYKYVNIMNKNQIRISYNFAFYDLLRLCKQAVTLVIYQGQQYKLLKIVQTAKKSGKKLQRGRTVQRMPTSVVNLRGLSIIVSSTHLSTRH